MLRIVRRRLFLLTLPELFQQRGHAVVALKSRSLDPVSSVVMTFSSEMLCHRKPNSGVIRPLSAYYLQLPPRGLYKFASDIPPSPKSFFLGVPKPSSTTTMLTKKCWL